jgi:7-keto-8-aminopelargonate synthetase-like enzyme
LSVTVRGQGAKVERGGKLFDDFTSFDYLKVAENPKVIRAAQQALERSGLGFSGTRTGIGSSRELVSLEERLARFYGQERAIVFSSRNQALLALFSALVSENDIIAFEETSLAPLYDAAYLLHAGVYPLPALSFERLAELAERSVTHPVLLFVDGLNPLTGLSIHGEQLVPLLGIDKRVHLVMDESYALAALGDRGSGGLEAARFVHQHLTIVGGFGFGCPGYGGFIAGSSVLIEYVRQTSRAIEVEPPIPPSIAASVEESIDQLELGIASRFKLVELAGLFRSKIALAGLKIDLAQRSPITLLPVSSLNVGRELVTWLESKGILTELVSLKGVGRESYALRIVFNSSISELQIDRLACLIVETLGAKIG